VAEIDAVVQHNAAYAADYAGPPARPPARALAVVACMDARLDLLPALGLRIGDAHILRNAGGLPTDDVLRSLTISQLALGTREIVLTHHTDCGMTGFDDAAFRTQLEQRSGVRPGWDVPGFGDVYAAVRESIRVVRECPWLPHRERVRGFVFVTELGRLDEVV
jgi:carbonic anhydrase